MKILIIKTSSLGDIIHAFPVVDYLRGRFPDATIDWVVEAPFADLVRSHPLVAQVLPVATKQWRRSLFSTKTAGEIRSFLRGLRKTSYDVVFDLQGNVKSGLILSGARSPKKVGFARKNVPEWPNMLFTNVKIAIPPTQNIRDDYLNVVTGYFGAHEKTKQGAGAPLKVSAEHTSSIDKVLVDPRVQRHMKVMVCPGSAWKNKQMTPEGLARFLKLIGENNETSFLFVWGSQEEKAVAEGLQKQFSANSVVVDRMPLAALQGLMQRCDLVISVDSLALHLAGTTATPTFAVFGSSSAHKYNPTGPRHGAFQGPCPYGRVFEKRCPVLRTCPTGACIRALTGDEVYASFDAWWYSLKKS